jgi:hypothetical protein
MSPQSSQSDGDGRPAEDEGRSFTTGIGSMVAPTADDETAPPTRPTFTARSSEPTIAAVPEPAPAPDDAAEQESTAATSPDLGLDDGIPAGPGGAPDAGTVPAADPAWADGDRMRGRPLSAAAGLDEPLLGDADGFRARWQRAQAGFIDDPREAVGDAADLIEQTAQALVGALRQRQRELRVLWERGLAEETAPADATDGADTEHLRLMMQRYRALFNQLCRP